MKKWVTKNGIIVIRLDGIRCNCFLIEAGGQIWLIDTSVLAERGRIVKQIEENGIDRLDGIILTHSHINHVESTSWFAQKYNCPVYVHDSELHFIQTGDCLIPKAARKSMELIEYIVRYISFLNKYPACREAKAIPREEALIPSEFIRIIETPGHSEGSISIIVDNELAIVGDAMKRRTGFSIFMAWANQPGLIVVSWRKLLEGECQYFLPSHGREIERRLIEEEVNKSK